MLNKVILSFLGVSGTIAVSSTAYSAVNFNSLFKSKNYDHKNFSSANKNDETDLIFLPSVKTFSEINPLPLISFSSSLSSEKNLQNLKESKSSLWLAVIFYKYGVPFLKSVGKDLAIEIAGDNESYVPNLKNTSVYKNLPKGFDLLSYTSTYIFLDVVDVTKVNKLLSEFKKVINYKEKIEKIKEKQQDIEDTFGTEFYEVLKRFLVEK